MTIKTAVAGESLRASEINAYYANAAIKYIDRVSISPDAAGIVMYSCFTSEFDAYRIVLSDMYSSSAGSILNLDMQFATAGTTPYAGATYQFVTENVTWVGSATNSAGNNQTRMRLGNIQGTPNTRKLGGVIEVINPAGSKAMVHGYTASGQGAALANGVATFVNGWVNNAATYTGFRMFTLAGTTVGGTVTVYGYRKQ